MRPFELHKLATLIGLDVQGAKNDKVAKIDDLCINANDGSIDYVVLSSGGVAGIGDTKRVLPWRDLQLTTIAKEGEDKCEARISLTEDQVKALREFDKKNLKAGKMEKAPAGTDGAMGGVLTCATEVKGHKVHNEANEHVGEVDDVIVDTSAGRVAYVVLGLGGALGMGEKHYALPWRSLHLAREGDGGDLKVHANVTKDRLKGAPEFDKDQWDKMRSPEWMRGVYSYYTVDPYWSGARPASSDKPSDKPKNNP